jgi:metal-responsive CopG/Arc/MetJ family transcriptional regulator
MSTRIHIVVPDELLGRIDEVRGLVPRSAWIDHALQAYLDSRSNGLPFEAERVAVRDAVERGATSVRVEAGSIKSGRPSVRDTWAR